jgi:tight adherence protein C
MSTIALLGAGCGLGIWLIVRAISARTSLSDVGDTLASPGRPALLPVASQRSVFEQRIVVQIVDLLRSAGADPTRRVADLRVARKTVDQHVLSKLTMALVFGAVTGLVLALVGLGPAYVVLLALAAALGGFLVPELILSSEAEDARKGFRHAYGAYLDIVNVMLAAGSGPEAALHTAADSGGGWAFAEIRNALASARSSQRSIAEAFATLGDELGIIELTELSASIALTGSQGARIRSSLIAKADALRAQQIIETEGEADTATERMALPVGLLLLSFIAFLGYPAVVSIGNVGG